MSCQLQSCKVLKKFSSNFIQNAVKENYDEKIALKNIQKIIINSYQCFKFFQIQLIELFRKIFASRLPLYLGNYF